MGLAPTNSCRLGAAMAPNPISTAMSVVPRDHVGEQTNRAAAGLMNRPATSTTNTSRHNRPQ